MHIKKTCRFLVEYIGRLTEEGETSVGIAFKMGRNGLADLFTGHKDSIDSVDGADVIGQLNSSRLDFRLVNHVELRACKQYRK